MSFKKQKLILRVTSLAIVTSALATEIYSVREADNLTTIIKNHFKGQKIYGPHGMLKKIKVLNPAIKNLDLIFVNQKIILPSSGSNEDLAANACKEDAAFNEKSSRAIANDFSTNDKWTLKALYGADYLSLNQTKTISGIDLKTVSLNHLKIETEFKYNDYKFIGNFQTHSFLYSSSTDSSHKKRLSSFELAGVWKEYLLGLSYKENSLVKAQSATSLEFVTENQLGIMLGYDKTWQMLTSTPTFVTSRSVVTIPFKNDSARTDVDFSSIKGLGLKSNLELSRTLLKKENYSLSIVWQNEIAYEKTSRTVRWGTSSGNVDLNKAEVKSLIGLSISF